ncbi:two-component sensor [Marinobacterium nitratireducens]|uniref:histidine kinase n=1 Tax=Marinobacterium nitratireducens TaxID=518897 RepID=A0A918DR58_9GAMM|nr:sensor histidine kinase [Marinobacterium nitratireducens]GGO78404.1 two-component sensor [Marinobacterium nitratireducens]
MKSIQNRLNGAFVVITLVLCVILWLSYSWFLRQTAYDFVSASLGSEAYVLLKSVEMDDDGGWRINPQYVAPVYEQPMSGHYFQFQVGEESKWHYSRSLWDESIPLEGGKPVGDDGLRLVDKHGRPWLVRSETFTKDGRALRMLLAADVSHIEAGLSRLRWTMMAVVALFLGVMLLAQVLVVRSGLQSLVRVRGQLNRLKEGDIRQLPDADTAEVEPLVTEINYLVQSMEMRLTRSRNALGNLAHAAKTPLTVLDRQIEALAQQAPDRAGPLREQSLQLRELMERELRRARIAGAALPGQRVFLQQEVDKLLRTLRAIYRDRGLAIESDIASGSYFPGERDDLVELLGNLLDNGCKWARRRVSIRGRMDERCLELCVEDDGPGIAPQLRERLLERGARLDESRAGHGLGMSIVGEIVGQYGGRLTLDEAAGGGLRACVMLPRRAGIDLSVRPPTP